MLERSVLEGKERDELHAIADALGVKPGSRTKKADLVDKILEATGVTPNGNGNGSANGSAESEAPAEKPKRAPRASKKTAEAASNDDAPAAAVTTDDAPKAQSSSDDAPAAEAAPARNRGFAARAAALAADTATDPASQVTVDIPTPDELAPLESSETSEPKTGFAGRPREDRGDNAPRAGGEGGGNNNRNQNRDRDRGEGGGGNNNRNQNQNRNQGGGNQNQPGEGNKRSNRRRRGRDRFDSLGGGGGGQARDMAGYQEQDAYEGETQPVAGLLDLADAGYGLIRVKGYLPSADDIYVPVAVVKRNGLRKGDRIVGTSRPAGNQEKYGAIVEVESVNGGSIEDMQKRPKFDDLTPLFPDQQLKLEMPGQPGNMVARIVDLLSPIGKGQRGLIVSPPKAGKTTVLKQIATSIEANNPDVHLMVLLVDERPEEVTDMRRSVSGEVVASTFDRPSDEHTQVAELAIERAKRLVEAGQDVVIVLDGITRLARAYNLAAPATGRIMSGGIDTGALYPPKKFFGAARNLDEGGSLTILATALIETGSKMDEVIFEEFKGTGNMELRLDRRLAEKRIYPAIDVNGSSTRREELLFEPKALQAVWKLRRVLNGLSADGTGAAALDLLMDKMKQTKTNAEFLGEIAAGPSPVA